MSADNGIYVAHFPDGYRVAEIFAIDNLDFYKIGTPERKQWLRDCFERSQVFSDKPSAIMFAHALAERAPILEYGVSYLGELESFQEEVIEPVMNAVSSQFIESIGYDLETESLVVRMKNGSEYLYSNVEPVMYIRFMQSESKGRFYNQHIKNSYDSEITVE